MSFGRPLDIVKRVRCATEEGSRLRMSQATISSISSSATPPIARVTQAKLRPRVNKTHIVSMVGAGKEVERWQGDGGVLPNAPLERADKFCEKWTRDSLCMCAYVAKQSGHRGSCGGSEASAGGTELAIAAARDMTERTIDVGCIAVSTLSSMFFCFAYFFCACRCNSNALCCLLTDVANRRIRGGVKSRGTPAMHYRLSCIGYGHCGSSHFRV